MIKSFTRCPKFVQQVTLICTCLLTVSWTQAAEPDWVVPKTERDYPDLQGLWSNVSQTPFQRPVELGLQRTYTVEQARALVERALAIDEERLSPLDPDRTAPEVGGAIDNQSDGNFQIMPTEVAHINGEYRTSIIIDPPNGRLPYKDNSIDIYQTRRDEGFGRFDGPEALRITDRCLPHNTQVPLLAVAGGPGTAVPGNEPARNIQIVQNRDYVVILSEYFSSVRIIRLSGEHIESTRRKWMGDSIAHYVGDSLIIQSRNFRPEQSNFIIRSSDEFEITESYTRVSENEIVFRYTATDQKIYSQPFTGEIQLKRMVPGQHLYEYSCHEGNYSTPTILRGARLEERRQENSQ